jgi:hypothetical protein
MRRSIFLRTKCRVPVEPKASASVERMFGLKWDQRMTRPVRRNLPKCCGRVCSAGTERGYIGDPTLEETAG